MLLRLLLLLVVLGVSGPAWATWSIVAVDPKTKEVGVAGASCTDYVSGIALLVPGKGANVSQAMSNPLARDIAQTLLAKGLSPKQILEVITRPEFDPANQQYGIVALGFENASAAYTGDKCGDAKGHFTGFGVSVQSNIMADPRIPRAVLDAYEKAAQNPQLHLSDRLLLALEAGAALGGDRRCGAQTARSAFLMVAKPNDSYSDLYLNLEIQGQKMGGPNPVKLLRAEYLKWQKYEKSLEPFITRALRDNKEPGLAVGIVEDGQLRYAHGFGEMVTGVPQYAITKSTLFHVSASAKPLIATAIMQLVEQGKMDLDSPVSKYLPYFRLKDARSQQITVRQMLTHTSGMPNVDSYRKELPEYSDGALEQYVRSLQDTELLSEPGTKYAYSNIAYDILGDLIAKVSGKTIEDYIETSIFQPLGMRASTMLLDRVNMENFANGYTQSLSGLLTPVSHSSDTRIHTPSSNLYSSVMDITKWAMANLNRGELDGHRILQESSYDVLWKPLREHGKVQPDRFVGMGWFIADRDGQVIISQDGTGNGFQSAIRLLPKRKAAVIVMVNSDRPIAAEIAEAMVGVVLD